MNLASKLDQLRGHAAGPDAEHTGVRRVRQRPDSIRPSPQQFQTSALADALGADRLGGELLMCRRVYPLPVHRDEEGELSGLPEVSGLSQADWVYIDTETTGLSGGTGNLAFMVGVARYRSDERLESRQYVLGSFAAESAMLKALFDWIGPDAVLVSYNGKCFDVPLLTTRLRMHRIKADPASLRHLDLMYSVRRAFRGHWPDCRLQTAERRLLGLRRIDDLPGSEAPAAWQSWLRAGETTQLKRVLTHNYQDVISLALLHRRLLSVYAGSARPGLNHAAIGMAWREAGQQEMACRVWERAGEYLDDKGRLQLAGLYRHLGEWSQAKALWLALHTRGNAPAALALSKYYEHRIRDIRKAIDFASCCDPADREVRFRRLQGKLGSCLQLPLILPPGRPSRQR